MWAPVQVSSALGAVCRHALSHSVSFYSWKWKSSRNMQGRAGSRHLSSPLCHTWAPLVMVEGVAASQPHGRLLGPGAEQHGHACACLEQFYLGPDGGTQVHLGQSGPQLCCLLQVATEPALGWEMDIGVRHWVNSDSKPRIEMNWEWWKGNYFTVICFVCVQFVFQLLPVAIHWMQKLWFLVVMFEAFANKKCPSRMKFNFTWLYNKQR